MSLFSCERNNNCTAVAVIASIVVGIITAFLQITGVITVSTVFLWVVLGVAVVYLAVLLVTAALKGETSAFRCVCAALNAALVGVLGSVLFSVVLLAVGIVATSVTSAIIVGLLLLFASLILTSSACLVRCLFNCRD